MREIIVVIDILAAIALVALVLLQQGKGADMGAAFGSGASQTLFGSRGTANFLTRTTAVLAIVFFGANVALYYVTNHTAAPPPSVTERTPGLPSAPSPTAPTAPSAPEAPKPPEPPK
jgi:preprotein translocase subunit SecG